MLIKTIDCMKVMHTSYLEELKEKYMSVKHEKRISVQKNMIES